MSTKEINIYAVQSQTTKPESHAVFFKGLPDKIADIVSVVQGIVIDKDLLDLYGTTLTSHQKEDLDSRYMEAILSRILERDNAPLTQARPPEKRFVGSCRDYALVLCSILRQKNIPARLRCGFDNYFNIKPDLYDDHWVCEYWDKEEKRWKLVDVNVDNVVKEKYKITIDTLDVPRDRFIVAGDAWQMARRGEVDPNSFGVSSIDIQGLWFIRGSIVRDLAALNKIEALPWDYWGIADKAPDDFPENDFTLLDKTANLISKADDIEELEAAYQKPGFAMPQKIKSYSPFMGLQEIEVESRYRE